MSRLDTAEAASAIARGINGQAPHVARYLARVDERLEELPNAACRRGFLGDELAKWQVRYARFGELVNSGHDPGDVMAFDYIETIAALDQRMEAVK